MNEKVKIALLLLGGVGATAASIAIPMTLATVKKVVSDQATWDKELPTGQIYKHKDGDGSFTTTLTDALGYVSDVPETSKVSTEEIIKVAKANSGKVVINDIEYTYG